MRGSSILHTWILLAVGLIGIEASPAWARGPSMGHVGGGGARPAAGRGGGGRPNVSRPGGSHANVSRPGGSRPSLPSVNSRPSPSKPVKLPGNAGGSMHPSGGRPNVSRPSSPPLANRPTSKLPGDLKPTTRPSFPTTGVKPPSPGLGRPGTDRPNFDRPSFDRPNLDRPNLDRPGGGRPGGGITTLPGNVNRPGAGTGIATRPSLPSINDRPGGGLGRPDRPGGGIDRPGGGIERPDRPGGITTLPARPGNGTRPNFPNRPEIPLPGRPGTGGDRPIIGGNRPGNDRPIINRPGGDNVVINRPGGGNINIGNINNRPGNININAPGWGWGAGSNWHGNHWHGGNWGDHWYDNHIHYHHHNWYHGCWSGNWAGYWYAPAVVGATAWGLNTLTAGWGYGGAYYNPYYVAAAAPAYDYSQPVVVNNYVTSNADAAGGTSEATAQVESPNEAAVKLFDQSLAAFKQADYRQALDECTQALQQMPKDPVLHEVRALCLFAVGDYQPAAATLNSLLASAPGMDWTTLSGLYGQIDDYTSQLRKLEAHVKANPDDASAIFLLAYHYLVIGQTESAVKALQRVVEKQPKDATAKRLLEALEPVTPPAPADSPAPPSPPAPGTTDGTPTDADGSQTDLVGKWTAKAGDHTIELMVDENSGFTWKTEEAGKPIEISGQLAATSDTLMLDGKTQGTMIGRVLSENADRFVFQLMGAPSSDPGLTFERVKK